MINIIIIIITIMIMESDKEFSWMQAARTLNLELVVLIVIQTLCPWGGELMLKPLSVLWKWCEASMYVCIFTDCIL